MFIGVLVCLAWTLDHANFRRPAAGVMVMPHVMNGPEHWRPA
jgi:hypothetical protein